ncbi:restriction endonuclease subunit S, partial [Pseudomonas aeruginosa]|nr:restriction endonuclease subunit S [Pseudomonas aeruginosa]
VHALRAHDAVARDYLCYVLMHYDVVPWLTGTTGRAKLTQGALLSLPIQVPPATEQTEIVRRVEQLFAFADQLEARVNAAKACIDRLTQSILAKAFRGELVPQDPNDEPASVLLERIKAQRAAAPKTKRGRKASA